MDSKCDHNEKGLKPCAEESAADSGNAPGDMPTVPQDLLASMAQSYFETDLDGRLTYFNDYICRFHGRPPDELRAMNYRDFVPAEQRQVVKEAFQLVFRTGKPSPIIEYDVVRKDGTLATAQVVVALRRDETGRPEGFCGIARDVSEQKKARQDHEEREARYHAIMAAFPYSITITRLSDSRYLQVNQGFIRRTGYTMAEVIGKTSLELNVYNDPADRDRLLGAMLRDGKVDGMEIAFRGKNGRINDTLVSCRRIQYDGQDCLMVISTDISDLKAAQRALYESEESHRAILDASPYSITISRKSDWTYVQVNDTFCLRSGYTKKEVVGRTSSDLGIYLNLADRERFIQTFVRDGKVDRLEIDFRAKDGRILENLVSARSIRFHGEDCVLTLSADISELKSVQRALQESEAGYRTILKAAPYSITISRLSDGRYVEVNEAFCQRTGYRVEEALGRTVKELSLYDDPDDLKRILKRFREQGRVDNMEISHRTRRGVLTTSLVSARPIQYKGEPCILFVTSNIDDLKETQKALEESETRFRTVFETAADPIFLNDVKSGRFIDVNQAACRHLGYDKGEFLHISIGDISDPPCAYPLTDLCSRQVDGNPFFFETRHVRKNGSRAIVEVSSQPMVHQGRRILLSIARDVTQRKSAEQELARYRENLEQMVAERTRDLEAAQNELVKREKLAVLGQLTATVSHELRNPLGVIRSSNFYLQRRVKPKDEKVEKHFLRIEEQVAMCEAIVSDLLEYTRGRHASLVRQEIHAWMEQVVQQVEEQEDIAIELKLARDVPPLPHDPEKMRRVMINVLLNAVQAVKAMANDATLKELTYQPHVAVETYSQDNHLVIEIRDNGIGMDEETQRRAFEPLFTTRARGTGIGLANVKKIIQEHEGHIDLESRAGQGTRVALQLPYASGR